MNANRRTYTADHEDIRADIVKEGDSPIALSFESTKQQTSDDEEEALGPACLMPTVRSRASISLGGGGAVL
ncbi:hypothetical protein M3Y99_00196500 [Aphelenchoides fujianensis]|nr:hypothetical protein M3Y99_00196500 [Aphelenchoides fujianensis]